MKLKYNAQPQKILELIHHRVVRADEVLERGKVYDIPNEIVDRCMETGFFEYVEEKKKAPKKVAKEEEKD
jgi:hypothetical protein